MSGTVHLVGAGPGAADLLTVRALRPDYRVEIEAAVGERAEVVEAIARVIAGEVLQE